MGWMIVLAVDLQLVTVTGVAVCLEITTETLLPD